MKIRLMRILLSSLCACLSPSEIINIGTVFVCPEDQSDKYGNLELTKQQVIEDIDFVISKIAEYHVSLVAGISDELIKQRNLKVQNLSDKTSVIDEWKIISEILSTLHDAHTTTFVPTCLSCFHFPLSHDKNFVCTYEELAGYKIVEINDRSINEIYDEFKNRFPHEIDEWCHSNFFCDYEVGKNENHTGYLVLGGIDIFSPLKIKFQKGNEIIEKEIRMLLSNEVLSLKNKDQTESPNDYVSYKIDKESDIAVFTLDSCDLNDRYINTVDALFDDVNKNRIKNIVIDVRNNHGGNSRVIEYFLAHVSFSNLKSVKSECRKNGQLHTYDYETISSEELRNLVSKKSGKCISNIFNGNLYVTTSNKTFSSGMWWAMLLQDNKIARVIGEVPGNSPTSYGDSSPSFTAPNSKIKFKSTFKKFYRPNKEADPNHIIPDIQISAKQAINIIYDIIKHDRFPVDCIFSIGTCCRPAHYLRKYGFRFQAAPFDWMMGYSLDEVAKQFKNKFKYFFANIEDITKNDQLSMYRTVRDSIGGTVSMHHFPKDVSANEYLATFRETMIRRAEKVDQIIKDSNCVGFLYESSLDDSDEIIKFGEEIKKLYPNKQIIIFNIVDSKENIPTCLYSINSTIENITIVRIEFNDIPDESLNKDNSWQGNASKWEKYVLPHIIASDKLKQRLSEAKEYES